jgi:hypothetical protein
MNTTEARQWGAIYGALMAMDAELPSVSPVRKQGLGSRIAKGFRTAIGKPRLFPGSKSSSQPRGNEGGTSRSLLPSASVAPKRQIGSTTTTTKGRHWWNPTRTTTTFSQPKGLFPKSGNDAGPWNGSKHPRKGGKFVSKGGGGKRPSGSGRLTGPRHPKFESMNHMMGPLSAVINLATYPARHTAKKKKEWDSIAQQIKDNSKIKNGVLQLTHPVPRKRKTATDDWSPESRAAALEARRRKTRGRTKPQGGMRPQTRMQSNFQSLMQRADPEKRAAVSGAFSNATGALGKTISGLKIAKHSNALKNAGINNRETMGQALGALKNDPSVSKVDLRQIASKYLGVPLGPKTKQEYLKQIESIWVLRSRMANQMKEAERVGPVWSM